MKCIYLDGEYVSPERWESSAALQTKAGVFETIRIKGNSPEYLKAHLARLNKGARFIGLIPPDADYEFLIEELRERNSLSGELAKLRIILFEEQGSLINEATTKANNCSCLIYELSAPSVRTCSGRAPKAFGALQLQSTYEKRKFLRNQGKTAHSCLMLEPYNPPSRNNYANGVKLSVARHPFYENDLARIKSTCRLPYSGLREKAAGEGNFDCLLTDADEEILETTIGNLFVWDGKEFIIPPMDSNRLWGIMERMIIRSLKRKGFNVREKSVRLKELTSEKGIFMTNSLIGVLPVMAVGDTVLKNVTGEPVIEELVRKFCPHKKFRLLRHSVPRNDFLCLSLRATERSVAIS